MFLTLQANPLHRWPRLRSGLRLHSQPLRISQPTRDQANLHPLHMRYRHHADPIRHGCCEWYVPPGIHDGAPLTNDTQIS